ncbi:MAG: GNAT family N-acetyltransferase [Candidatus Lokiarchaeota archaeon]|nr:GNAT family N-acetyltransferase [Candidatus Lokiarchaeota archaeon]
MFDDLNSLYRLTKLDIDLAGKIAAKAYFEADDFSSLSTDPSKRMKNLMKIMGMTFRYSLKFGVVYASSQNLEGVAAWLPHDKVKIPIWQYVRLGMLPVIIRAGKKVRNELLRYDRLAKNKHKENANFPHLYLYNLAVDPKHQGKGWASVLLNPMLAKADKERLPCYLESPERNVSLYEHFGFEVLEHISLPDSDNDIWLMIRYSM